MSTMSYFFFLVKINRLSKTNLVTLPVSNYIPMQLTHFLQNLHFLLPLTKIFPSLTIFSFYLSYFGELPLYYPFISPIFYSICSVSCSPLFLATCHTFRVFAIIQKLNENYLFPPITISL